MSKPADDHISQQQAQTLAHRLSKKKDELHEARNEIQHLSFKAKRLERGLEDVRESSTQVQVKEMADDALREAETARLGLLNAFRKIEKALHVTATNSSRVKRISEIVRDAPFGTAPHFSGEGSQS